MTISESLDGFESFDAGSNDVFFFAMNYKIQKKETGFRLFSHL
jgi:hypothetical protein